MKNHKGATVPLRSDLAADLKAWTENRDPDDLTLYVSSGVLQIMNWTLAAAGIQKLDSLDSRIHVHALRQVTSTQLLKANISSRTALGRGLTQRSVAHDGFLPGCTVA